MKEQRPHYPSPKSCSFRGRGWGQVHLCPSIDQSPPQGGGDFNLFLPPPLKVLNMFGRRSNGPMSARCFLRLGLTDWSEFVVPPSLSRLWPHPVAHKMAAPSGVEAAPGVC